jgi:hypothetical protein
VVKAALTSPAVNTRRAVLATARREWSSRVAWWVRRFVPRILVLEFVATPDGVRAGVWVAPIVNADEVVALVTRCWPGARAALGAPPALGAPNDRRTRTTTTGSATTTSTAMGGAPGGVSAVHVVARGGPWAPLLDPTRAPRELRPGEVDPLHGVWETLAEHRPGQTAVVQLIVAAHLDRRHGRGLGDGQGRRLVSRVVVTVLTGLLRLVAALLVEIVTIMTHHGPRPGGATGPDQHPAPVKTPPASEDPAEVARRRDLAAKQARGRTCAPPCASPS